MGAARKLKAPREEPRLRAVPALPDANVFGGWDDTKPETEEVNLGDKPIYIGPQPGPQTDFLTTTADIALYGGAAGGGKSFALLLEPLRHADNGRFGAVVFRRNSTQVRNEGGLWDESMLLYRPLGAHPREASLEHEFPSGMRVKFAHLENEKTIYDWQGAQIPLICFDELTHFTEKQFWYMLSRNRSTSRVPGYVRATCNPDADSWVAKLVAWYIDEEGYPIPERSGAVRWFVRRDNVTYWADTAEELIARFGAKAKPKSFTFIAAKLEDNAILMEADPDYEANLEALDYVDRMRLRDGNWKVRASAGNIFNRDWFKFVPAIPSGWIQVVRYWDRAATKPHAGNKDPDWTRGVLLYRYPQGKYVVADMRSMQDTPGKVEDLIVTTAEHDGYHVKVRSQRDPGSAGVSEAHRFVTMLQGFDVETEVITRNKLARAKPASAQVEIGNVSLLRGPWNEAFLAELEGFPDGAHDDAVDAFSGAFNELSQGLSILDAM